MTGITWLHLSDWHEGRPQEVYCNRDVVLGKLIDDIRKRDRIDTRLTKVDFIVFSGDVAFSGEKEQYDRAEEFFDLVLEAAGLEGRRDHLFIVPGNHDLDEKRLEKLNEEFQQPLDSEPGQSWKWIDKFLRDNGNRNLLLNPFTAYGEFVSKYTGQEDPEYSSLKKKNFNGVGVTFLGLNSALMARRKSTGQEKTGERGKLIVGNHQVEMELSKIEENTVKIAVLHHPLDWLCEDDEQEIKNLLTSKFDFILYGHRHRYQASQVVDISGNCVLIAAGATYESREHPNAYNFVYYDPENRQGRVYIRRWDNDCRQWIKAPFLSKDKVVYTGYYELFTPPPLPRPQSRKIGEEALNEDERIKRLNKHYEDLAKAITEGTVVPFLGTDINLCGRPQTQVSNPWAWDINGVYPPTNLELAAYIDLQFKDLATLRCPFCDPHTPGDPKDPNFPGGFPPECPLNTKQVTWLDLPHLSQFFWSSSQPQKGAPLRNAINNIYSGSYNSNELYQFLATTLIEKCNCQEIDLLKGMSPYPLIVTTCFDRTLEKVFEQSQQPYDWVSYSAKDMCFSYQKYDWVTDEHEKKEFKSSNLISLEEASKNEEVCSLKERPVILRLYGPVVKGNHGEHFAITEDHFLKYLIHAEKAKFPDNLLAKLCNSYLWFLGYNLSYWHLRIILHQITAELSDFQQFKWWAVQENPQPLERELWDIYQVLLFSNLSIPSLEEYIKKVTQTLESLNTTTQSVL